MTNHTPSDQRACDTAAAGMSAGIPVLLTYKQAGELLQVSDRTVWTLVKTGQLKAVRFGHTVRIDRRDLEQFIQEGKDGRGVRDGK